MADERYNRGWEPLKSIHDTVADKTVEGVADVAPALGDMIVAKELKCDRTCLGW